MRKVERMMGGVYWRGKTKTSVPEMTLVGSVCVAGMLGAIVTSQFLIQGAPSTLGCTVQLQVIRWMELVGVRAFIE